MKKNLCISFWAMLLALCMGFLSCNTDPLNSVEPIDPVEPINPTEPIKKELFNGYVQKGPYVNGASVMITQLDTNLNQTGAVFSTQIIDNAGSFEQRNIEFTSSFVELKADGYYFNEVKGEVSTSPLTLYALADVSDVNSVNVNILTHLERQRIMYLIQNDKLSFSDAKQLARSEVLNIFKFVLPENTSNESLNIVDDALLLAVSAIIQGHLSTGDMSELLANISSDIRTDGKLDNPALGTQLMNNAAYIDLEQVKTNMINKYSGLGIDVKVNSYDLSSYIQQFKVNCGFEQTLFISYPESGKYGLNILHEGFVEAERSIDKDNYFVPYSIQAVLPSGISNLKIIIRPTEDTSWGTSSDFNNWEYKSYRENGKNIVSYKAIENGRMAEARVIFRNDCVIEYYENDAIEPTKTKEIKVIK